MNKKGITMISLIFYVLSFIIVVSVIGTITMYVSMNYNDLSAKTDVAYTKNQIDKYFRKFMRENDKYKIMYSDPDGFDTTKFGGNPKILFIEEDLLNEIVKINRFWYYQENIGEEGLLFLDVYEYNITDGISNAIQKKRIFIAKNIIDFNVSEEEKILGKQYKVNFKVNNVLNENLYYGVEK